MNDEEMRKALAEVLRSAARDLYFLAARYMARAEELDPDPTPEVDEADRDWP